MRCADPAHVVRPSERPEERFPDGAGWFANPIGPAVGASHVMQILARFRPGAESEIVRKPNEEVLYVVEGDGAVRAGSRHYELTPGTAILIPPWASGWLINPGPGELHLVVAVSPPLGDEAPSSAPVGEEASELALVREQDEDEIPAGHDRYFKLLIDPRHGCQNVTQFVGFIERSRAPFHTHTHEEAIYILSGSGIVHVGDRDVPIANGTSIFLPPGTPHCLENDGPEALKLLGVFSPAGSPADRQDAED
jgi:quercetin dioxygenase-like cupin family protein